MSKLNVENLSHVGFFCPGCNEFHHVSLVQGDPASWHWNGSVDKPTLSPSVLVRSGHHIPNHGDECWCTYEKRYGKEPPFKCYVCHSFVREGQIEFLSDCTHALAGKTVDLPSLEEVTP